MNEHNGDKILHENSPFRVVQRPGMDNPSLVLISGSTIPAEKNDVVLNTLLNTAILATSITLEQLIEVGDILAEYFNS